MPISLPQLGKIYALTESPSQAEAAAAEETFRKMFFRWCDEQGLPSDHGLVTFEVDPFQSLLFDTIAPYLGVRYAEMGPFHTAIIGPLEMCRWIETLRNYVVPKTEPGTKTLSGAHKQAYEVGVCTGVRAVLEDEYGRPDPKPLSTPVEVASAAPVSAAAPEAVSVVTPTPSPRPALHSNILLQGRRLGISLARKVVATKRPPRRAGSDDRR